MVMENTEITEIVVGSRRFDYVKYSEHNLKLQGEFKKTFMDLERRIECIGSNLRVSETYDPAVVRARSLALTALEECYMWIGKAIRDVEIKETGALDFAQRTNE